MNKELKNKINYFNKYGFVILRKVITKKNIDDLFREIETIKLKAIKTRNKRFYHLTKDKKINTIHNIQKFYKSKILTSLSRISVSQPWPSHPDFQDLASALEAMILVI